MKLQDSNPNLPYLIRIGTSLFLCASSTMQLSLEELWSGNKHYKNSFITNSSSYLRQRSCSWNVPSSNNISKLSLKSEDKNFFSQRRRLNMLFLTYKELNMRVGNSQGKSEQAFEWIHLDSLTAVRGILKIKMHARIILNINHTFIYICWRSLQR